MNTSAARKTGAFTSGPCSTSACGTSVGLIADKKMDEVTILFRPVGQNELKLIEESGSKAFPPRLPEQPIFYPVLNEEYATQIARDWNAKYNASKRGYV